MKAIQKSSWISYAALMLGLPTAYFLFAALLKYEFDIPGPFDAVYPLLQSLGVSEPIGWNINLLILFGPLVGLMLAMFQVVSFHWEFTKQHFQLQLSVQRKWLPFFVIGFCGILLTILFLYMLGENCNCPVG